MIEIVIPGTPIPWKSHGGYGRKSYDPRYLEKQTFREIIRDQYQGELIDYAIDLDTIFYLQIPASVSQKTKEKMLSGEIRPTKRPDGTNMRKLYEDCLKKTVITDDSIVVGGRTEKWYGVNPRTILMISPASQRNIF